MSHVRRVVLASCLAALLAAPGVAQAAGAPGVLTLPATNVTCCSARLSGIVGIKHAAGAGKVSDWVVLERDGGPAPVVMISGAGRLPNRTGTYRLHLTWSELPSCSAFRFWYVAKNKRGASVGNVQTFSTSCPRHYVSWSIGQYYRGAPASAPALGTIDTQPSAQALGKALNGLGYHNHTKLSGQRPDAILREAPAAAVIAIFDHASAGNILTSGNGTNLCLTYGLVASGRYTFACAASRWPGLGDLPPEALWSVKLMIFSGCETANSTRYYGNLVHKATKLGVSAVIGFRSLIYSPSSTHNASKLYGNYFWARFAHYIRNGRTIRSALRRSESDLVKHTGKAWGYDSWVIDGAAANPGGQRLTISGPHAAGDRTVKHDNAGDLVEYEAPVPASPDHSLSQAAARREATHFLTARAPRIAAGGLAPVQAQVVTHERGRPVEEVTYRSRLDGIPGPAVAQVEIDLRSGQVVDETAAEVRPSSTHFAVGRAQALEIARRSLDGRGTVLSAQRDIWSYPRWTVTFRTPFGQSVVEIDGGDGHVVGVGSADAEA